MVDVFQNWNVGMIKVNFGETGPKNTNQNETRIEKYKTGRNKERREEENQEGRKYR